jgi:SAM-dependent methyltransferase
MDKEDIKKAVRNKYGRISGGSASCCSPQKPCCGNQASVLSRGIGYTDEELAGIPQASNLGLGCGNPVALAAIKEGETVLDLGSGAGIDCFLAAERVGPGGKVIGVDMTPEMVEKARENAREGNYGNVEFRLGEIENIPAADNCVDLIISNCVINLSPDKKRVFKEAFRVLKPGGRLMVSDIVLRKELPASIRNSVEAYVGCISGAMLKEEYLHAVEFTGFTEVKVISEQSFPVENCANDPLAGTLGRELGLNAEEFKNMADSVLSISLYAKKPEFYMY